MAQAGFHPVWGGEVGEASLPKHLASWGPPKEERKKKKETLRREREKELVCGTSQSYDFSCNLGDSIGLI